MAAVLRFLLANIPRIHDGNTCFRTAGSRELNSESGWMFSQGGATA